MQRTQEIVCGGETMSTTSIEIDTILLSQLIKAGILDVVDNIAKAGAKMLSLSRQNLKIGNSNFEHWYAQYPKHTQKLDAKKAYLQMLRQGYTEDEIMAGTKRDVIVSRAGTKQYIKNPAAWLRAGGWMDDYDDETTVHDRMRKALLNGLHEPDEINDVSTERLLSPIQSTRSISDGRSEDEKDQANRRGRKQFDPF
jgi:hypothetical protein